MDTSVWIGYLSGTETEVVGRFTEILNRGDAVGLTGVVYQEVVQASPRGTSSSARRST